MRNTTMKNEGMTKKEAPPELENTRTTTAKLVRLWLWHHGPARSLAQIERELGISHAALWRAKKQLIEEKRWKEAPKEIETE